MKKLLKILLAFFAFCFFTFAIVEPVNMAGNWYQQFLPSLNNEPISDILFLDSLTGFAVTGDGSPNDTNYILKTTNSGDNWVIKYRTYRDFYKIKFINQNTGFACGGFNSIGQGLFKTTNAGENWFNINAPFSIWFEDMAVFNEDTIWLVQGSSGDGGVFFTSNGGANWIQQANFGSSNPSHIYMYNTRIGFIDGLKKTTNGGQNWNPIAGGEPSLFFDMHFHDSLLGWKCHQNMRKTTDGGVTWVNQTVPSGGILITSGINNFHNINKDTIWGVGGLAFYGSGQFRGVLYRTTNGGNNWLFQIPDTTIHSAAYQRIQFIDKYKGWAYWGLGGIHTVLGGDTTFIVGLQQVSNNIPKRFELHQNYPNPFNPVTNIRYELKEKSIVNLTVYDVTGRQVSVLVNQTQHAGIYETDFKAVNLSSGVYFYKILVTADNFTYTDTKKMILVK